MDDRRRATALTPFAPPIEKERELWEPPSSTFSLCRGGILLLFSLFLFPCSSSSDAGEAVTPFRK